MHGGAGGGPASGTLDTCSAERWSADRLVSDGDDLGYRWSLVAVTASVDDDRGDQDPSTWLPQQGRCPDLAALLP